MTEKYIIFSPFTAGFTNVLMSYEIAFAVSYLTSRALILPPTSWCVLVDEKNSPKETWQNIWEVCDKDIAKKEFEIHDLLDFKELNFLISTDNSTHSWIDDNPKIKNLSIVDSDLCFFDSSNDINKNDFEKFSYGRPTYDLNIDDRFLKLSGFGHYWYNIFASDTIARNEMKHKVNKALRYRPKYYDLALTAIREKSKNYNAIHVRNPKQLIFDNYTDVVQYKDNPEVLLNQVSRLYKNDKPLYISTDIESKSFFDILKSKYQIIFQEDLNLPKMKHIEKIAVDQIICSDAELFYGSYYSTFSKRINIMRGIEGKQADDYMGFNKIIDVPDYCSSMIPWQLNEFKHWEWHASSHCQWMKE